MIFRQFFEPISSTYSYLIADKGDTVIIDPVKEDTDKYIQIIRELDLKLIISIDTHVHADHITASGRLNTLTDCDIVMGQETAAEFVTHRVKENDTLAVGSIKIKALYTPGHTDDSYSFRMNDRVFTGDTLLIRSTGRTDFQNGNPIHQYDSIFNKLLKLPDATLIYPAHDYRGWTVSTIAEEKRHNPRLQVNSEADYVAQMNALKLAHPKQMDVAVPANLKCGK